MACRYQTADSFERTIDQVLTLVPDRVAMFSYAHVPWLKKQQGSFQTYLPEGKEKFRIFRAGMERFLGAGYLYIGMDHFARPGDELAIAQQNRTLHRNFQGYTTKAGADLYGMGVSAISSIGEAYAAKSPRGSGLSGHRRLARNCHHARLSPLARRRDPPRRDRPAALPHRNSQARSRARIFHFLRRIFRRRNWQQLEEPRDEGLVALEPGEIRVTPLGRIFIRNVAMIFDRYLREQQMDQRPLFSKRSEAILNMPNPNTCRRDWRGNFRPGLRLSASAARVSPYASRSVRSMPAA